MVQSHRAAFRAAQPGLPAALLGPPAQRSTPRPSGARGLRAAAPGGATRSRYRGGHRFAKPPRSPETAALRRLHSLRLQKVAEEWEPSPQAETPALSRACPKPPSRCRRLSWALRHRRPASPHRSRDPFPARGSGPGGLRGAAPSRDRPGPGSDGPAPSEQEGARPRAARVSLRGAVRACAAAAPREAREAAPGGRNYFQETRAPGSAGRRGEGGGASQSGGGRGSRGLLSSPRSSLLSRLPFPRGYFGSSCGGGRSLKSTLPPSFPVRRRRGGGSGR